MEGAEAEGDAAFFLLGGSEAEAGDSAPVAEEADADDEAEVAMGCASRSI